MIIPLSIMSIIPLCGWYSITHMLHVCYIYLHNWVIYVGQMLGWIIFQHHGLHMGSHSPYNHRMIDRMDIVEIPSVMETSGHLRKRDTRSFWPEGLSTKVDRICSTIPMGRSMVILLGGWPSPLKNYGVRQLGWWHSQYMQGQQLNTFWNILGLQVS